MYCNYILQLCSKLLFNHWPYSVYLYICTCPLAINFADMPINILCLSLSLSLNRMYISSDSDSLETNPVWSYISFICCCFFNFQFHNHEIHYSLYRFCFLFHMDTFFGGIRCRFIIYISCQMFRKHALLSSYSRECPFTFGTSGVKTVCLLYWCIFVLCIVTLFVISICSLILR